MRRNEKKLRERQMLIKWSKQCQVCQGLDDFELHTIISILQGRKLRLKEGKRLGTTMPVLFSRGHFKYLEEKFLSNINVPTLVINLVYFYFYFLILVKALKIVEIFVKFILQIRQTNCAPNIPGVVLLLTYIGLRRTDYLHNVHSMNSQLFSLG